MLNRIIPTSVCHRMKHKKYFVCTSLPEKFLSVLLRVAFEKWNHLPDGVKHLMRAHQRPLARPHDTQQRVQLFRQAPAKIKHTSSSSSVININIDSVNQSFKGHEFDKTKFSKSREN